MNDKEDLSAEANHSQELDTLQQEIAVPSGLEDRVVSTLKRKQLIRSTANPTGKVRTILAAAAACVLFFFAGRFFERTHLPTATPSVSMSERTYVLFLRTGTNYREAQTPEEEDKRVEDYRNWAIDLRKKGLMIDGTKLRNEIRLVNSKHSTDPEPIGGYFLVDAENEDQAMKIANSCPHISYGGTIEVRRVHPV